MPNVTRQEQMRPQKPGVLLLLISVMVDIIGFVSYAIPGLGEQAVRVICVLHYLSI